jgi:REP element-mobilizing transposase RayT
MKRAKQLSLFKDPRKNTKRWWIEKQTTYGGSMEYRKVARPFDSKKLTHVVFSARLGTALRFTKSKQSTHKLLERLAKKYAVKIYELAVNHDHIHVLFATKRRQNQINFLRFFAAEMGRKYHAIARSFGIRAKGSIWRKRPFTRLVGWQKRSLAIVKNYIQKNRHEVLGFIDYQPRFHRLDQFLKRWAAQNGMSSA